LYSLSHSSSAFFNSSVNPYTLYHFSTKFLGVKLLHLYCKSLPVVTCKNIDFYKVRLGSDGVLTPTEP